MADKMLELYKKLPITMQNFICSCYGWKAKRQRFSKDFYRLFEWLLNSQYWSKKEIDEYKNKQLQLLIEHAYNTVPYYHKIFVDYGITPKDIVTTDDLIKLPILTKDLVRTNQDNLISQKYSKKSLVHGHTSGTTGKSLDYYKRDNEIAFQWAIWYRHRARFDCKLGDLHVNFTGKPIVPINQNNPPFWRYNTPLKQYLCCMQSLNNKNLAALVDFLNGIKPRFYSGYPSIIAEVARLSLENGFAINSSAKPNAIFFGAELLLQEQRQILQKWLGSEVILTDQYGVSEGCGNASKCEHGIYHEDFEFCHLEAIETEKRADNLLQGKIIATGFCGYAMPFIRYEIGDVGAWSTERIICGCGRSSNVFLSIEGRNEDYILVPEGRKIMRFDYIFKDTPTIRESQVCQYESGKALIKIVPTKDYSFNTEDELRRLVKVWISPSLKIDFEYVDHIPREPSGKFRAVKSFLDKK